MISTTCSAAYCTRLHHCVLLSAGVPYIVNTQCLMLVYLPDMTFPYNGCNVNDSSEKCTQRYHTDWGGGGGVFFFEQPLVQSNTTRGLFLETEV
jgi:hypothetical protein